MRTTLRIDDDLLRELKEMAQRENESLTKTVNHVIRRGLRNSAEAEQARPPYREQVFSLGEARVPLVKALALAAEMEDVEVLEEMARRR